MPTNVIESANHRQQDASHEHRDNVLKQTSQGISRGHKKKTPWFRVFANAAVKNSHQIMAKAKLMPSSALWTEGNAQRWWHYSAYTLWQPSQASVIECVWGWGNTNAREDQLDSLCLHMHKDAVPGHSTIDFQHTSVPSCISWASTATQSTPNHDYCSNVAIQVSLGWDLSCIPFGAENRVQESIRALMHKTCQNITIDESSTHTSQQFVR